MTPEEALIRPLVLWPNPMLKKKSDPVKPEDINSLEINGLVMAMIATMRANRGLGLSAIQIGVPRRIVVAEVDGTTAVFINPVIVHRGAAKESMREGCLSVPGIYESVSRNTVITVDACPMNSTILARQTFTGLHAQVLQHEIEHLDGKLFVDRLDPGARDRVRAQMRKTRL